MNAAFSRVIVFSTDDHLYPAGGAEQAFGNIASRMPDVQFDLICARLRRHTPSYEEVGNVRIHRIGVGVPKIDSILLALTGHRTARRIMRGAKCDLVWSIMASYGAFAAVRFARATGTPFLLTLQEGDSFEHIAKRTRYVRKSFRQIFERATALHAISRHLLAWGVSMGYRGDAKAVIPNGVDIALYQKTFSIEERGETRASFGFPRDAFVLFTSSRLEPKNGIEDVIEAMQLLPDDVCFVICGSGSLSERIEGKIRKYGLSHRVAMKGFVDPQSLPLLMSVSDVFIRPSLSEGLGTAFLEAMAARLLVVGTGEGGIPDFLENERTGFVVRTHDPAHIAEVVTTIMHLPNERREEVRARAAEMVSTTYDWNLIATEMRTLMEKVSTRT